MRHLLFAALIPLIVSFGPAAASAKPAVAKFLPPVRYVCEDGTRLSVTFSKPDTSPATAILRVLGTGTELTLSQATSADGGRYTNSSTELWDKGATASFTTGGKAVPCRRKR